MDWLSLDSKKLELLKALSNGQFSITHHAAERMAERGVSIRDLIHCADTAHSMEWQDSPSSYRIDGCDQQGDELTLIAVEKNDVFVVTIY